ncbi:MAG: DUF502 domain-containing protein [Prolixibacteraceae bacterium]|nr:DUF502 domain-containing protein [Prolixibacteraceae bacterium]
MMKRIFSYFLQGILFIAPTVIIVYILYSIFVRIDSWVASNIEKVIGFSLPGLGIVFLFITITLLGFVGQTAVVKPLKRGAEKVIKRIPLLNLLYSSFNDLFSAFVGKEKKFNTPVKVFFNKENGLYKLGFITKESLTEIGNEELAAVYFPHSYNFSGELYLVPADRIEKIDMSPSEVMKFIVSGGVTHIE